MLVNSNKVEIVRIGDAFKPLLEAMLHARTLAISKTRGTASVGTETILLLKPDDLEIVVKMLVSLGSFNIKFITEIPGEDSITYETQGIVSKFNLEVQTYEDMADELNKTPLVKEDDEVQEPVSGLPPQVEEDETEIREL